MLSCLPASHSTQKRIPHLKLVHNSSSPDVIHVCAYRHTSAYKCMYTCLSVKSSYQGMYAYRCMCVCIHLKYVHPHMHIGIHKTHTEVHLYMHTCTHIYMLTLLRKKKSHKFLPTVAHSDPLFTQTAQPTPGREIGVTNSGPQLRRHQKGTALMKRRSG